MYIQYTVILLVLLRKAAFGHPNPVGDIPEVAFQRYREHPERAAAIKEAFRYSWDGYLRHAFPGDTLRSVTNGRLDDRNGWGATAVDALGTALVMGEFDVADTILQSISTTNFGVTDDTVNVFETTIRYLGGLLSGYDLLKGPFGHAKQDARAEDNLLAQAYDLASNLQVAFGTDTGIPDNELVFDPRPRRSGVATTSLATAGTLVLEWTRLADLTGDCYFADIAQRAESYLLYPRKQDEAWPGLLGHNIDIDNGTFTDKDGGWAGGTDSFYEYLIKMYVYDPERFSGYKDHWIAAVDSTIAHLTSVPSAAPSLEFGLFLASYMDGKPIRKSGHLACFAGGNFILGGMVLGMPKYIDVGLQLTDGCHETYNTSTGIGPELFQWQDAKATTNNGPPPANQAAFYSEKGFWINVGQYILRPEVIESYYYAYRATGSPKYQDWAWDAFVAINKTCRVGSGFAGIRDVDDPTGGGFLDFQESFWFAETLKYSYLIQTNASLEVQVQSEHHGEDGWVFNTEGHPLKRPCGKNSDEEQCSRRCRDYLSGRP